MQNLLTAASSESTFTEAITPYLPLLGTILGGILIGVFAIWNRRRGAVETRAPDVNEIWQQQALQSKELDAERKQRRHLEDVLRDLLYAFRSYISRVQGGGSVELTTREQKLLDIASTQEVKIINNNEERYGT